jgi:hypothetical protein
MRSIFFERSKSSGVAVICRGGPAVEATIQIEKIFLFI